MKLHVQGLLRIVSLLSLTACGASSPAANGGNSAGSAAGGGASGASGATGSVACGRTICQAPDGFTGELCCHDIFSAVCGEKTMADLCSIFPAQQDAMCPDGTVVQSVGAMLVRGCCIADTNQCGLDLTGGGILAGTNCSTYDAANTFSSFSTGPDGSTARTNIPAPTHCDGTPSM